MIKYKIEIHTVELFGERGGLCPAEKPELHSILHCNLGKWYNLKEIHIGADYTIPNII